MHGVRKPYRVSVRTQSIPEKPRRALCARHRQGSLYAFTALGSSCFAGCAFFESLCSHDIMPQLRAHFFDGMLLLGFAQRSKLLAARFFLFDPLAGEGAVLNAGKGFFHASAGLIPDHDRASREIAILGGV